MMEDYPNFLKLAKAVSKLSDYKIKHGAVLVRHGKVISLGCNKIKYSRIFSSKLKRTIHAEAFAIKNAQKSNIRNSIMFVYREDKNGKIKCSKPCESCQSLLEKYKVKRVYFSIENYPYFEIMEL